MTERLKNLPAPQPLPFSKRLHEEVKLGRVDIGYKTWDGPADELPEWYKNLKTPGMDTGRGYFTTKKSEAE